MPVREPPPSPSFSPRTARAWWGAESLVAGIVLALVVITALMMGQALRVERARRATAARALQDYATIAAWHYAQAAQADLHDVSQELAQPVGGLTLAGPTSLPPPEVLLPVERYSSRPRVAALTRFAFRLDVARRELRVVGGDAPEALRSWLRVRLPIVAAAGGADSHGSAVDTAGGRLWAFYYHKVRQGTSLEPGIVYGIVADGSATTERLATVHRASELLPPPLAGPPPQQQLVGIRVLHPNGRTLYAAGPSGDDLVTGRDTMTVGQGGYRIVATLSADLAQSSVLGVGRLPVWSTAVTLLLALLLAGVALVQLRRTRALTRLREQFVASVSHELRTPLTQISMFGETLMHERERSASERRHFAGVIFREARRLTTLVENVLRFSSQGAEAARISARELALEEELGEAAAAFAPLAEAARVRVDVEVEPGLCASADAAALRQIALNLLDNAVKYGPRAQRVLVTARAVGDHVEIAVEDEGPGIAPADRARAFEPFVRLPRAGMPAVAGTGIGLSVVRTLARAMGGTARVEDASSRGGARFVVTLPASTTAALRDSRPRAAAAAVGEGSS